MIHDPRNAPEPFGIGDALSMADAEAVDALVEAEFDLERVPAGLRERAAAAARLFARLDDLPSAATDADLEALSDATLVRIDREETMRRSSLRIETHIAPRQRSRLADFVAVACVLILAISISVPLTNHVRTSRGIEACGNGLRSFGGAMASYANDHEGLMPFNASLLPNLDGLFPTSGAYHHGDHLEQVVEGGYCDGATCSGCPNHPEAGGGWSYRVPGSLQERRLDQVPRLIIVADRNPVIELVLRDQVVRLEMCSPEHGDRGQNVLRGDGSTEFLRTATVTSGDGTTDNIWLPPQGDDVIGQPVGGAANDIFLLN